MVQVNATTVKDFALNDNTAASNTASIHIDTIKPTVTFLGVPTNKRNRNFPITIRFNEDVPGFVEGGITLSPITLATVSSFSG